MSDVKWIRIAANIFDNRKIKMLEAMPDGDTLIVIWFKILSLAGNVNDNGFVYFTKDMAYTPQMLSTAFGRPLTTIELALDTFEKFGMIEKVDAIIHISNWEKYQNADGLEKIREQNRLRQQKRRERLKLECHVTNNVTDNVTVTDDNVMDSVTVTQRHALDRDIDIDRDRELDRDINHYPIDATEELLQSIMDEWNSLSDLGINKVRILGPKTDRTKNLLRQLSHYGRESFGVCIENIKKSDYLQGNTGHTPIQFGWLVENDENYAKVYEGAYTNYDKPKEPAKKESARVVKNFAWGSSGQDISTLEEQLLDN